MGIQAEAIDKVLELAPPTFHTENGIVYSDRDLNAIVPPISSKFDVQTLDGLVNLLSAGVEGFDPASYLAQVANETTVRVVERKSDIHGRRKVLIEAVALKGLQQFQFGSYQAQENFLIGLASGFEPTPDLDYLVGIASVLDQKESVKLADDGISQSVTASKGVAFKENVVLRNRVTLAPFRSFREISQPQSDFIFRAREGGQLALFEADGGAWKIAAINAVAEWLKNNLSGSGLGELPIIS
jgi:hypothetical protein